MTNEDTKNRRGIVVVLNAIVARWVQTTSPGPVRAVVYFMAAPADKRRRREGGRMSVCQGLWSQTCYNALVSICMNTCTLSKCKVH